MLESKSSGAGGGISPGGFEFGIVGFQWAEPIPKSITFFLDNTAMVTDQYGRQIRRAISPDGAEVKFADCAPDASREGDIFPRPQFATHAQTLAALRGEKVDWLAYNVRWYTSQGPRVRTGLTFDEACKLQSSLAKDSAVNQRVTLERMVVTAGWPQLPYEELVKLPPSALPPVATAPEDQDAYLHQLMKIRDKELRRAALRMRREMYEGVAAEMESMMEE